MVHPEKSKTPFSSEQKSNLLNWLKAVPPTAHLFSNASPATLDVSPFSHGQSNPTFLLTLSISGTSQRVVLRSRPSGALLKGAHRIDREYRVLSALKSTPLPTPVPYAYCHDLSVLGVEFYTMSFVSGLIFTDVSLSNLSDPAERTQVFTEALRILNILRSLDIDHLNLTTLSRSSPSWLDRQVDTWYRQFCDSRVENEDYSTMELLFKRLNGLRSKGMHQKNVLSLVHGDFRIDNLVFNRRDGRLECTAVLDWELVSLGEPLADLASLLTSYHLPPFSDSIPLLCPAFVQPIPEGIPSEEDLIRLYIQENPRNEKDTRSRLKLYLVVAMFKFAAILYGVYRRSLQGNAVSSHASSMNRYAEIFAKCGLTLCDELQSDQNGLQGSMTQPRSLTESVWSFVEKEVLPLECSYFNHVKSEQRWSVWSPIEQLKSKAKKANLWNLFLPKSLNGSLTAEEYAPLAEIMGRCLFASEVFNCSAPDTGMSTMQSTCSFWCVFAFWFLIF